MSSLLSHVQFPGLGGFTGADALDLTAYAPTRGWNFANRSTLTYDSAGLVSSIAGVWGTSTALAQPGATTLRPTTGTRAINGYHCLDFDGSTDYMQDTTLGVGNSITSTHSFVAVMYLDATTGNIVGANATNGLCVQTGSTMACNTQGAVNMANYNTSTISANVAYVLGLTYRRVGSGSDVYWNLNGVTETDAIATNTGGAGTLRVGLGNGTEYLNGLVGMLAIWQPGLSTTDLDAVCSAVKTAWGI